MRTEPRIALCRCYEKGAAKRLLSQISGQVSAPNLQQS
jgi:hypothetical protein